MKTLSIPAIALASALVFGGCASTRYDQSAGQYLDSKTLNAKVKAELFKDDLVKGSEIDVDVWKSVVQLNGFVDRQDQVQRAEAIAWSVGGVRDVRNNLVVKESMAVGSPARSPQVGQATGQDAEIMFGRILSDPSFHYGKRVALAGKVDTIFSPYAFTVKGPKDVSDRRLLVIADRETVAKLTPDESVRVEGQFERFDKDNAEKRLSQPLADSQFDKWQGEPVLVLNSISEWSGAKSNQRDSR